ncbi:hypothetical protein [Tunturiibacter gelidiferens]|uniref:hypothetical protein n=1 Tax=Tunturiibacter gelidiferens TaxID=3069689 RepID=UPI003D9AC272
MKAEMDAAASTARERASGKAGQAAKKTELQGGDNKPIRQGPKPRRIRKIPRYFRLADDPELTSTVGIESELL